MRILKEEHLGQDGKAVQGGCGGGQHVQMHRGKDVAGMNPRAAENRVISPKEIHAQDVQSPRSLEEARGLLYSATH